MASQIERERVFGNFKPSKGHRVRERRTKKSAADRREGMSKEHLACIRQCFCVACLPSIRKADHAHHLLQTGDRGMGLRSQDKDAVPLCFHHHEEVHRRGSKNEAQVFSSWGIPDALQLAADLYRSTGDAAKMNAVCFAHRGISK